MIIRFPLLFKVFNLRCTGITIFPFIFIDIRSTHPSYDMLITHEKIHLKQELKYLVIPFFVLYLVSSKFRFTMELQAYTTDIKYLLRYKSKNNVTTHIVSLLCDPMYRNMCTEKEARSKVTEIINNLHL